MTAADASVRPARPGDADAVAAVQSRAWRLFYADLLARDVLRALESDVGSLARAWAPALTPGAGGGSRALVACAGELVVGVAVLLRHDADHAELTTLVVDPLHVGHGHGSRLLSAVADLAREDGARVLSTWTPLRDERRRAFLTSAGLAPDGARRELEGGPAPVVEVRLVAALGDQQHDEQHDRQDDDPEGARG